MSELPTLYECFKAPHEQKVVPGEPANYVGVYLLYTWITVQTLNPPGFRFGKIERWRPIFECALPAELQTAEEGAYFAIWFQGVPSERGRYGDYARGARHPYQAHQARQRVEAG